jgi:hypothetical protein
MLRTGQAGNLHRVEAYAVPLFCHTPRASPPASPRGPLKGMIRSQNQAWGRKSAKTLRMWLRTSSRLPISARRCAYVAVFLISFGLRVASSGPHFFASYDPGYRNFEFYDSNYQARRTEMIVRHYPNVPFYPDCRRRQAATEISERSALSRIVMSQLGETMFNVRRSRDS